MLESLAMLSALALAGALAVAPGASAQASTPAALQRGLPFWETLAKDCRIPEGETAFGLVSEALELLGQPDSSWRDDVGWGVVYRCVYRGHALDADQRRTLIGRLVANLRVGIGETGTDGVLLRSFSALDLATFAALENQDPALDAEGFRRLWQAALDYLRDERDVRGFDPRVGWIHSVAHTADLLKFLARNPRVTPADQRQLLDAVVQKLIRPGTGVFTHGENERLAATLLSLARRDDFDPTRLDAWLEGFVTRERAVWAQSPPDPERLAAAQNGRSLLDSLYVQLSFADPEPTPGQQAVRERVLATLTQIRR